MGQLWIWPRLWTPPVLDCGSQTKSGSYIFCPPTQAKNDTIKTNMLLSEDMPHKFLNWRRSWSQRIDGFEDCS